MSGTDWTALLDEVAAVPGVRAALVATVDDGLVVREVVRDDLPVADVAALVAALVRRAARVAAAAATGAPTLVQVRAAGGTIVAAPGPEPLWLVAVAAPEAELGRLRLLLGDRAGTLA